MTTATTQDSRSPRPRKEPALDAAGLTHPGQHRDKNEDSYLIATLQRSMLVHDASPSARGWFAGDSAGTMLIVADGMGGQGGGDVASRVAVDAVVNHLLNCMPWLTRRSAKSASTARASLPGVREQLSTALVEGDSTVRHAGVQTGVPQMGTTLTMALVLGSAAYIAHVGDSRGYVLHHGELRRLTRDHTLAQRLADEAAETVGPESTLHHILWNALGATPDLPQPEIQKLALDPGDVLLLCSDGLTRHVSDPQIETILRAPVPARERCAMLVESANSGGGLDNITAVVAQTRAAKPA
jgi:serine/threonine protein phosphatase PrpC